MAETKAKPGVDKVWSKKNAFNVAPEVGTRFGAQKWVPNLAPRSGYQIWCPEVGTKFGAQKCVPDLVPRSGYPIWRSIRNII